MKTQKLEELLQAGRKPDTDISLLQARILKAALQTPQDEPRSKFRRRTHYTNIANWKSIAATLILTTGIGFGLGQMRTNNTNYLSAEALLSLSIASDFDETGLEQGLEGN